MAPDKRIGAPCSLLHSIVPVRSVQPYRADELWGGKLRGAILSRAAHIVFLRIQVKHAHRSDLMRDPLEAGPVPALGAVRCGARLRRNEVGRCIGRRRVRSNPIRELVGSFLLYSPRFADHYSSRVPPPAHIVAARWFDEVTHAGRHTTEASAIAARSHPAYDANLPLHAGMVPSIETTLMHPRRGFIKLEDTVVVTETGWDAFGDKGRDWNCGVATI
jgi:hypothetical protein